MEFTVWVLKADGTAEPVGAGPVSAEQAESMTRHPSLSGSRVVVLPTWAGAPSLN
jgi:hypothetical protein